MTRDYSIVGDETSVAIDRGLADGDWFKADIEPSRLKELSQRSNLRPTVDAIIWLSLAIGLAVVAWSVRGTWWTIPAFLAYGAIAGGASDARWHEFGHGTAFKTSWINDLLYLPASFMLAREATYWRWSHFRHHSDTIVVGRDPEIIFPRPPAFRTVALTFSNLVGGPTAMRQTAKHAIGRLDEVTLELVPVSDLRKVVWEARAYLAVWLGAVIWALLTVSLYPLLLIGGPTIYGFWFVVFFGITQHAGLREDVLDHRVSTRTVYMNPVFRFLYLNMNYHVEHHMFPTVPYYRLPALHAEIKDQLAEPLPSTWAAYREIFTALGHQRTEPTWELERAVPDVAGRSGRIDQSFVWAGDSEWIDLGEDVPDPGEVRCVTVGDRAFVLARLSSGELVLADDQCPHGRAQLSEGTLVGNDIECPKHNGRFALPSGEATRRPAKEPLRTYEIRRSANGNPAVSTKEIDEGGRYAN